MAGFDSESGPGMGQAIREAGKAGQVVATCVEAEEQHLRLVKEGVLHGLRRPEAGAVHLPGRDDARRHRASAADLLGQRPGGGHLPAPVIHNTGTYTVTRETVDLFLPATSRG